MSFPDDGDDFDLDNKVDEEDSSDDSDDDDSDDHHGEGCTCKFCRHYDRNILLFNSVYADNDSDDEYEYTSRFKARVIKSLDDELEKIENNQTNFEDNAYSWSITKKKKLSFFDDSE